MSDHASAPDLRHETYLRMCGLWEDEHSDHLMWLDDDRTDDYTPAVEHAPAPRHTPRLASSRAEQQERSVASALYGGRSGDVTAAPVNPPVQRRAA